MEGTDARMSSSASTSAPANAPIASTSTSPSHDSPGSHVLEDANMPTDLPSELSFDLVFSWRGQKQAITVQELDTVGDLKMLLWSLTSVPPDRQKIVGLVKGKLPGDEQEVVKLGLGNTNKKEFMLIGTPEGEESKAKAVGPSMQDDADVDYAAAETRKKADQAVQSARNRRKLKEAADKLELSIMAPPRPGKKLLVLDLDGCILDTSLWKHDNFAFPTEMFARPYLHDFLRLVSPHYDIMPWSQTSWRWLESKLAELSMIGPTRKADYHIVSTVDRSPMFSIYSERDGKPFAHEVKALGILWAKFPGQYSAANTIHVDDLSRNFALNPANGLKVKAYKDALTRDRMSSDKELLYVARYLLQVANHEDLTKLDHSRFKKCKRALPAGVSDPLELAAPAPSASQAQPAAAGETSPPPPPPAHPPQ